MCRGEAGARTALQTFAPVVCSPKSACTRGWEEGPCLPPTPGGVAGPRRASASRGGAPLCRNASPPSIWEQGPAETASLPGTQPPLHRLLPARGGWGSGPDGVHRQAARACASLTVGSNPALASSARERHPEPVGCARVTGDPGARIPSSPVFWKTAERQLDSAVLSVVTGAQRGQCAHGRPCLRPHRTRPCDPPRPFRDSPQVPPAASGDVAPWSCGTCSEVHGRMPTFNGTRVSESPCLSAHT